MVCLCVIDLLKLYNEKDVKLQTFKVKNNDCDNEESFDIKKADGNSIEMSCNTVLSFRLMNVRMQCSGPDLFNYFAKCLTMNALAEWRIVTPLAQEDCTKDSFLTVQQAWLESLLPHHAFLCQKEWMNNTLKRPFTMKVQEFGNRLRVFNHLLDLFPQSGEDRNFTDGELKTIFLTAMPLAWQQAYTLQGTRATDTYKELVAYFTTYQSIVDTNNHSKITIPTEQMLSLRGQNINHF